MVAKFPVATREKANSARGKLSEAAMSTLLADGVYVETTLTVEIEAGRAKDQITSAVSSSAAVVAATAAGAVAVAAIIGGAYIFIKRRTGSSPSTASPSIGEMDVPVDVEANAVANIKAMERVYSLRI